MSKGNDGDGEGYEVGYGRPPKSSQFQKGQSGNPDGRRKSPKRPPAAPESVAALIAKEGARIVTATENGKLIKATVLEMIVRQRHNSAMRGDARAAKDVIGWQNQYVSNSPILPDSEELEKLDTVELAKAYSNFMKLTGSHRR